MTDQLMKNRAALEIYVEISQRIVYNVENFAKEGTGFEVRAIHCPQGEGSDLDEHEIEVFQLEGDLKAAIFTTYVNTSEKAKEVIDLLKNFLPADLVEYN